MIAYAWVAVCVVCSGPLTSACPAPALCLIPFRSSTFPGRKRHPSSALTFDRCYASVGSLQSYGGSLRGQVCSCEQSGA